MEMLLLLALIPPLRDPSETLVQGNIVDMISVGDSPPILASEALEENPLSDNEAGPELERMGEMDSSWRSMVIEFGGIWNTDDDEEYLLLSVPELPGRVVR